MDRDNDAFLLQLSNAFILALSCKVSSTSDASLSSVVTKKRKAPTVPPPVLPEQTEVVKASVTEEDSGSAVSHASTPSDVPPLASSTPTVDPSASDESVAASPQPPGETHAAEISSWNRFLADLCDSLDSQQHSYNVTAL